MLHHLHFDEHLLFDYALSLFSFIYFCIYFYVYVYIYDYIYVSPIILSIIYALLFYTCILLYDIG